MSAHSTWLEAGSGRGAPGKNICTNDDNDAFGQLAHAKTHIERLRCAWEICRQENPQPGAYTPSGWPVPYTITRLIWSHSKNGPHEGRLTLLDSWRIVLDFMHTHRAAREGGDGGKL